MNLRYVVPALGIVALSATAASAQEIAKGVNLDGYVDNIFTGTTGNDAFGSSTTDFSTEAVLKVGWAPTDRISGFIATRTGYGDNNPAFAVTEAYGKANAAPGLDVYAGRSAGPFGYYSPYATGLSTINAGLSTHLYTINPVGTWVSYAPSDKITVTAILADKFYNVDTTGTGDASARNKPGTVSPGLDIVANVTPEVSLNLEGWVDPSGSPATDADGHFGNVYDVGFNAQFKQGPILAMAEIIYQVVQNNGETVDDSQKRVGWAAFVSYAIPDTKIPTAVTAQVSGYKDGATATTADDKVVKAQLDLLTNPLTASQFGLNYELFYQQEDNGGDEKIKSYGVAVEALFVIP